MHSATIWIVIILTGLGTFLLRLSFINLYGKIKMHTLLKKSLRFIPPAVFAALVLPALLYNSDSVINISLHNYRLLAGIIAAFLAWKLKNVLLTTFVGLGALWVFQWIM